MFAAPGETVGSELPGDVTGLLQVWRAGDRNALDALVPQVYKELHRLAHFQLRKERPDHTLQSAALVHEAYARLVGQEPLDFESRGHFFAVAAQLMRQILVDYARRHRAEKRGGGSCKLTLDDALKTLAELDPRQSRVVELRFFAGLSLEETAQVLEIGPATVQRDWTAARAWLHREISRRPEA